LLIDRVHALEIRRLQICFAHHEIDRAVGEVARECLEIDLCEHRPFVAHRISFRLVRLGRPRADAKRLPRRRIARVGLHRHRPAAEPMRQHPAARGELPAQLGLVPQRFPMALPVGVFERVEQRLLARTHRKIPQQPAIRHREDAQEADGLCGEQRRHREVRIGLAQIRGRRAPR
jgi:hypothetical protein